MAKKSSPTGKADRLTGKYFVRRTTSGTWEDITTKFAGIKVLSIDGFNEVGEAVNVYTEQWFDSQQEDFMVTKQVNGENVVVRKNCNLSLTFIVSRRYALGDIDEQTVYNNIVNYICWHGDFYIKSTYTNKQAHVICTESFKPTAQKLNRGASSFILVTVPLHTLSNPIAVS